MSIDIILRVSLAFLCAILGAGISASIKLSHDRLCALISLAAGTLLGVTVFSIFPETAHDMSWWELLLSGGSGYLVFFLISKHVYHVCPACAASHFDETTMHRFSKIANALIIALGIHSTLDGVALAVGHHHSHGLDTSLIVAISTHKLPEGLALGALLLGAGYSRSRALMWTAGVELTTVLGGILGFALLRNASMFWVNATLAHAGGGFIYLAIHALLGELLKHGKTKVILNFVIGAATIAALHLLMH